MKFKGAWRLYDIQQQTYTTETWDSLITLGPTRIGYLSNDKWGVMTPTAEPLTPAKYRAIQPFRAGMAAVHVGFNHWAYIDSSGQEVIKGPFRRAKSFQDESGGCGFPIAAVESKKGVGYITSDGKWHIKPRYHEGESFNEGFALAERKERLRYIDCDGRELPVPDPFEIGSDFVNGLAVVQAESEAGWLYGYLHTSGEYAIEPSFHDAYVFSDNRAIVISEQGEYGFIDPEGTFVLPTIYQSAWQFNSGRAFVKGDDDYWRMIGTKGDFVLPDVKYAQARPFEDGLARVYQIGQGWTYIDTNGEAMTRIVYDDLAPFMNGYAPVLLGDKWGLIDRQGKQVVDSQFDAVGGVFR
ncbi:MAG: WG repeat-containing protein [Bacteroidota bacterium]